MNNQSKLVDVDDHELTIVLLALRILSIELETLELETKEVLAQEKRRERNNESYARSCERKKQNKTKYPTWSSIEEELPDNIFRRKFRMTKSAFRKLCNTICMKIGETVFNPENHCRPGNIPL